MRIRGRLISLTAIVVAVMPAFAQDRFVCHPDHLGLHDPEIRDARETDSYLAIATAGKTADGRDRIVNLLENQSRTASAMLWTDNSRMVIMDAKYQDGGIGGRGSEDYRCFVRTGLGSGFRFTNETSLEINGGTHYPIPAVLPVLEDDRPEANGSANFNVSLFSATFSDAAAPEVKSGSLSARPTDDGVEITIAASSARLSVAFSTSLFSDWNDEVLEPLRDQVPGIRVGNVMDLGIISTEEERSPREYFAYNDKFVLLGDMAAPVVFTVSGTTSSRAPIYLLDESGEVLLGAPIN